jgi:hypothetical protein
LALNFVRSNSSSPFASDFVNAFSPVCFSTKI